MWAVLKLIPADQQLFAYITDNNITKGDCVFSDYL